MVNKLLWKTELWNGSTWTEVNDLNTDREQLVGLDQDNTSALCFGNAPYTAITEDWNGSGWAETGDMNVGRMH